MLNVFFLISTTSSLVFAAYILSTLRRCGCKLGALGNLEELFLGPYLLENSTRLAIAQEISPGGVVARMVVNSI